MKFICALILWLVLFQVSKEDTVPAESHQIDKQSEEIESKNNQIQIPIEEGIGLKREPEIKNDKFKDSQAIETELHREFESKYDSVGKCLMPTVRGELTRQQRIMEKLEKNLSEKQKDEINKVLRDFHSNSRILENCEKELTIQKNTTNRLKEKVKQLVSELQGPYLRSCIKILSSGPQFITLSNGYTFKVLCNSNIAGPGWTVIQQRIDGKVNFYRNWDTYRDGFGDFWDGEFFLGLEMIHQLTADQPHELYIHMESFNGSTFHARYDEFAIAGEDDHYRLIKLGKLTGHPSDGLIWHYQMRFTTYDRDNDEHVSVNCAVARHGSWWYNRCTSSNLNGKYYDSEMTIEDSMFWQDYISLKRVKMMIRPRVTSE